MLGYSRESFYRLKELYDKGGELALQEMSRKKPILANRTAPEIAARIVEFSLEQPAFGQIRVANKSSCCLTIRCEWPRRRIRHSWTSCKAPMRPRPMRAIGIAQHSNARREFRVCRVQFHSARLPLVN